MKNAVVFAPLVVLAILATAPAAAEPIRLASDPALSPDGAKLAFSWRGDLWLVPATGGVAQQLTIHPARDTAPKFSPDGKQIAFTSDRSGSRQVYVVDVDGGAPKQLTFHTEGSSVEDWYPDGRAVLTSGTRDHFWRHAERFFRVAVAQRSAEELLFNDYGSHGVLSPDGRRLLFTRDGPAWWRKGYRGSQASQVWLYEIPAKRFTKIADHETGCREPLWKPDASSFYYVGGQSGSFNLYLRDLASNRDRQLTHFDDDSVVMPAISRDGSTIVFRHLFDLYRLRLGEGEAPERLDIDCDSDDCPDPEQRKVFDTATDVAFSEDGLEIAFIAGGNLWVMDTELREPRQITETPEEERDPVFAPDGKSILYVSDAEGQCDLWKATRKDPNQYWWQNDQFDRTRLTNDPETESRATFSPLGDRIALVKGRGDLCLMTSDGKEVRCLRPSWDRPEYDWSPDGKWIVYSENDSDFNRDIWLVPVDRSHEPFNLSRHPDDDAEPRWSPDGKMIAFTGKRGDNEVDICFVFLEKEADEADSRDRRLEKALEKMKKERSKRRPGEPSKDPSKEELSPSGADGPSMLDGPTHSSPRPLAGEGQGVRAGGSEAASKPSGSAKPDEPEKKSPPKVAIDFDGIYERIRRVSIPNSVEHGLFWSHDSKKLAFTATVDGKEGTYTVSPPDDLQPKLLTATTGAHARWLAHDNQIVWLSRDTPASVSSSGTVTSYRFQVLDRIDVPARHQAAFDLCWRAMRDDYYDAALGRRNWDDIRRKYTEAARAAAAPEDLAEVVQLMLGELNGSHLGFIPIVRGEASRGQWREATAHLGVRFDPDYRGPGLRIKDVIPKGPACQVKCRLLPGEVVLAIDGTAVDPGMDLTTVLNGPPARDIELSVRNAKGEKRVVPLRPISYERARDLLYDAWIHDNQESVEKVSKGAMGYLHIRSMDMPSFYEFERDLYAAGAGKEGLVIDVRENGGGSTTDHLLTALMQPVHAITVPRGGQAGYPQDRKVYATWNKPIVVLCNQNSFSNAEIFTHAIQTLKRGKVIGVPTAGGVLSTGSRAIMDVGFLRMPTRGWFVLNDGQDMELNGARPEYVVWPQPGELPEGKDRQLEKAIEVLKAEIDRWHKRPQPRLVKASER